MSVDRPSRQDNPRERGGWLSRWRGEAELGGEAVEAVALGLPEPPHDDAAAAPDLAGVVLRGTQALVERGWCQRNEAVDALGGAVEPLDVRAVRWSVAGAMEGVRQALERGGHSPEAIRSGYERAELALAATVRDGLAAWNDTPGRTGIEVLGALEEAIERAERVGRRLSRSLPADMPTPGDPEPARSRPPLPAFELRRRELDRFLGEFDKDVWRSGFNGVRTAKTIDPTSSLADALTQRDRDSESAARRGAQLVAGVLIQSAEARLRTFAGMGARLAGSEREALAALLRLPAERRVALSTVLRDLSAEDLASIATALGLSDPECQALALVLSDSYPAEGD